MSFLYQVLVENDPGHSFGPVYHGGTWDGTTPIRVNGKGALGVGAYFTPIREKADGYRKENGGQVVTAYLRINKPLVIHVDPNQHPCVQALVTLGMDEEKAFSLVEKTEERYGYMGNQIKNLALKQGYDGIFEYFNGNLMEVVIWDSSQVKVSQE